MNDRIDSLIDLWGLLFSMDVWPVLARPEAFWLLLVPVALALWGRRRRARLDGYADPELRPWAFASSSTGGRSRWTGVARLLWAAFWLLAVLALADPRLPQEGESAGETRAPLLFVVDGTATMSGRDVQPDRIERAVMLMELLIESQPERSMGLLRSVDTAGVLLPPSPDATLLAFYARQLPGLVDDRLVARPDRAFRLATEMEALAGGAVIWLTSADSRQFAGERGSRVLAATERLAERGIPLFAVSLARERTPLFKDALPRRNDDNEVIVSKPAFERVAELAGLTDGAARRTGVLQDDAAFLREQVEALPAPPRASEMLEGYRSLAVLALWPAMAVLLLYLWLEWGGAAGRGRRAWLVGGLLLLLPLLFTAAEAAPVVEETERAGHLERGWTAMEAGEFARAQSAFDRATGFTARLGSGLAAFRRGDYPHAAERLQAAAWLAEDDEGRMLALFNLGNALTLAGRYGAAVSAFDAVLANDPEHTDAKHNRDLVASIRGAGVDERDEPQPEFQGYESVPERSVDETEGARMADEFLEAEGSGQGGQLADQSPGEGTAFALDEGLLSGARKKLERIEDRPRPPIEGLLRQQPYKAVVRDELTGGEAETDE